MEKFNITRKDLYDLMWSKPMSFLIKKYGITYTEIRKACSDMNIPIPENGYWSKIQFGKPVVIENLSEDYSGKNEVTFIMNKKKSKSSNSQSKIESESIPERTKSPYYVPDRLTNPDILITNAKDYFDAVKRYNWRNGGSYPSRENILNIDVTNDKLPRALRFMDALIKLLRLRNHSITLRNRKTFAIIYEGEIEIRLKEKNIVSATKDQYGSRQLEATGKFVFMIGDYNKKEVGDGIDLIETKLDVIIAKLEAEGEREKQQRIANDEWRKNYDEELRIKKENEERIEKEKNDFTDLFHHASRFHQANILRAYIQTVEANAIKSGNAKDEFKDWIKWARDKADWYDPLVNKEDTLLSNKYRNIVFRDFIKEWQ